MSFLHVADVGLLAAAGGGGSGGDEGGELLFAIGYAPMHLLGRFFRKRDMAHIGGFITWPVAVLYSILLITVFRGWGFVMAIGAIVGAGAGLYGWWGKLRRNKKAEAQLQQAAAQDSAWQPDALMTYAAQVMQRFQYDWSLGDTENMKRYLTPWYHYHISLMMAALKLTGRVNRMSDVEIVEQHIQEIHDAEHDHEDSFVIGFQIKAKDELVEAKSGQVLFTNKKPFVEFWSFARNGNTWLLQSIMPATANLNSENLTIKQFAEQNRFGYSLDWGWLLLPQRGQLFGKGKFGVSDINNHVIGVYNDVLIQIYSYIPNPQAPQKQFLIAQTQLPKYYGNIVVRRKKGVRIFRRGIRGLRQVKTEWNDFNKKYQVYASTAEGATSLELLHPAFMEVLEAQPFEVNIEVVDNIVYFYTQEKKIQSAHYPAFLDILREAFKQMKM